MTGFGRGAGAREGLRVAADVRTLNHRHLDLDVRGSLPAELEARVRKLVSGRLSRGKVDVSLTLSATEARAAAYSIDTGLVHALVAALRELGRELDVAGELTMEHLAQLPWSRAVDAAVPDLTPAQQDAILAAVDQALDGTIAVRRREGEELAADLRGRLDLLRAHLAVVRRESAGMVQAQLERLRQRMAELASGVEVGEERLAQEAALLADRSDVAEEITRLSAYVEQVGELLDGTGPVGKRLDFTLQEAFREVNTIGSKARGLAAAGAVIEMKSELERMREQVANVE